MIDLPLDAGQYWTKTTRKVSFSAAAHAAHLYFYIYISLQSKYMNMCISRDCNNALSFARDADAKKNSLTAAELTGHEPKK